ncbi:hypothetical protein VTN49DRAFT_1778 [Thermomyces lanuginosus]|uniref:uncharacterized protein n=1 Tax=Thermomyces lanuginosus TaxID=5541 RepID=UPI003744231C
MRHFFLIVISSDLMMTIEENHRGLKGPVLSPRVKLRELPVYGSHGSKPVDILPTIADLDSQMDEHWRI